MYAIRESFDGRVSGGRSADLSGGDWWTGRAWSPAAGEARTFDTEEEARQEAVARCQARDWAVIELDD